jgi:arylsulfatase A-like enzyme
MKKKPNVIFILSDDHCCNAIGAYNSILAPYCPTQNIDKLAKEGMKMKSLYCGNALCSPSRATILTGLQSQLNGVKTLGDKMDPKLNNFPKIFKNNGYQTALFGKWHLHSKPQGFKHFDILPGQGVYFDPVFINENADWDNIPENIPVDEMDAWIAKKSGKMSRGYVSDVITDKALDFLKDRDAKSPFMMLVHHKAPHDYFEYHPRDEHFLDDVTIPEPPSLYEDKSHRSIGSKNFGTTISNTNKRRNMIMSVSDPSYPHPVTKMEGLSDEEQTHAAYQRYLKDYLKCIKGIDDNVKRIVDELKSEGIYDDTIIIYSSDQGMFLGEHDYIDKRWIFNEAMQMPFIIKGVKGEDLPFSEDTLASNTDIAPTLLNLCGLTDMENIQGLKFQDRKDKPIYYRYWMHMTHHDIPAHLGIRDKNYLLIYFYGKPLDATGALDFETPEGWELYDLKKDPFEMKNVFDEPSYKETRERLISLLLKEAIESKDETKTLKEGIAKLNNK